MGGVKERTPAAPGRWVDKLTSAQSSVGHGRRLSRLNTPLRTQLQRNRSHLRSRTETTAGINQACHPGLATYGTPIGQRAAQTTGSMSVRAFAASPRLAPCGCRGAPGALALARMSLGACG
eukprot:359543-Chlamydomonas_euryale.AAC.8